MPETPSPFVRPLHFHFVNSLSREQRSWPSSRPFCSGPSSEPADSRGRATPASVSMSRSMFGKQTANITQALTLTLLFRSGGAVIFGVLSGPLSSTSGSSRSSSSVPASARRHLGPRCLHRALEPPCGACAASRVACCSRGYAVGYLIAAVISLDLVLTAHVGWRSLFWTASGIGVFGACLCALLPESRILVKARLAAESHAVVFEAQKMRVLLRAMPKKHWALCVFLSHGSQDLYPTHTQKTKGFNPHTANDLGIGARSPAAPSPGGPRSSWGGGIRLSPSRSSPRSSSRAASAASRGGRSLCSLACRARGVLSPSTSRRWRRLRPTRPSLVSRTSSAAWSPAHPRRLSRRRAPEDDDQGHGARLREGARDPVMDISVS
ncbi:hypothetical protein B0H14DRAFT_1185051 [Mycena olivaceomarginata]|nr:hypothetical protein B0H14DRAFT_1185051 [Mycena olivaceomarginata]